MAKTPPAATGKKASGARTPLISVIIPTFNRANALAATLASLADQTLPGDRYEVVIVDDGSNDATQEVCHGFAAKMSLKYLHIDNSGIAEAKNRGILAARGEILLFADDDDIADHRLLEEHLKAHDRHPDESVAVLGYTTWAPTLKVTPLMRYVTEIGGFLFAYRNLTDGQTLDFRYFWGGRSSCKRSFLIKHGLFDPRFRTIIEDMELGYRLSKVGLSVVFHRAAISYMARPLTVKDFCNRCERQGKALFLFSSLYDDPVVQQYCKIGDPFREKRVLEEDPESRWSEVAAFFPEKLEQLGRVEPAFVETEAVELHYSNYLAQAEAYRVQLRDLSTNLQDALVEIRERELEVAQLKTVLQRREASHQAELQGREAQLEDIMANHRMEIEQLEERLQEQFEQFAQINRVLQDRNIALSEREQRIMELKERLRKQLGATRKLSRFLADVDSAAARLRSSRRWKLANPGAAIKSKLAHGKKPVGYGHLEKIIASYEQWRKAHPEVSDIDEQIQTLTKPANTIPNAAAFQESAPISPPVPEIPIQSIQFKQHDDVDVSIIIPVFNQFQYTHACLASLQTIEQEARFEVIVVDDGSTDETADLISRVPNLIYVRNETNSGFVTSCNRGAAQARGKYLVFLNNDTTVKSGWLTALLETFADEPRAGIVGSKLIYPDGRLQEAGCITWRDATGWNYGKFDDPRKPEYNYVREVDYCSGAALMIPNSLFQNVGGFDSRYAPAYYEDTDLAFKVRNQGYRVLYQPLAEIVHYEGVTGGKDLSTGAKKHQEINRATFAERWTNELQEKPDNGDLKGLQQVGSGGKRILVIDHHLPMPDRDSGSLRMFQILRLLHQLGHRVTFIPDNLADIPPYTGELQKRGVEVQYYPYVTSVREYLESNGSMFDIVVLSRCDFAYQHIENVRLHAPQSRVIFDTVDLHFLRTKREAQVTQDPEAQRKAEEKERLEYELIDLADETWVVSEVEQELLREARPERSIQVVSNIVDVVGSRTPFSLRRDWLFIGSFQHTPNIDAMIFFLREICPRVQQELTDAKFYIIGEKVPQEVIALANERVVIAGRQPDVGPFFENVKLSIAPLRYGAGVKGKINQSMAWGVPVVATSVAVEGMELRAGEDVLVADEPMQFADAIITLYRSEDLWNRLSQNGLEKARAKYSVETARENLRALFSDEHLRSSSNSSEMVKEREDAVPANVYAGL